MKQTAKNVSPMSNEGRNTYVIQHITAALLELLQTKNIQEISVRELCEKAGVGRVSFYRNFESKEDILKLYIRQLFQEWENLFKQENTVPLSGQIRILFSHFKKHQDFYRLLNDRGLIFLLKDVIIGIYAPNVQCAPAEAYSAAFVAYSLYGWVEVWFQRGMKETPEELEALFGGEQK